MVRILIDFLAGVIFGAVMCLVSRKKPREFVRCDPVSLENAVEDLLSDVRGGSPHAYEPRDDVSHLKIEDLRRALERRRHEGTHVFYFSGGNYQTGSRIKSQ